MSWIKYLNGSRDVRTVRTEDGIPIPNPLASLLKREEHDRLTRGANVTVRTFHLAVEEERKAYEEVMDQVANKVVFLITLPEKVFDWGVKDYIILLHWAEVYAEIPPGVMGG